MGESHDSGRVPGLGRIMDDGISSGGSRTFGGKSRDPLSFSRSGLKMGDFVTQVSRRIRRAFQRFFGEGSRNYQREEVAAFRLRNSPG